MSKIKVFLADDHQMFLDGLHSLLSQIENLEVLGTANNGKQLLDKLQTSPRCDVAIVDIHMPVMDGIETARQVKQKYPYIKILALTMNNDMDAIREMLQVGASGYVLKNTGKAELEMAIDKVAGGEFYLSQSVGQQLAQDMFISKSKAKENGQDPNAVLTEREKEILRMIALEYTNFEIAEQLYISPKTVETHRKNLMKKIGVKNSLGIYKYATKHHLI